MFFRSSKKARLQSPSDSPDSQDSEGSHNSQASSRASAHSLLYSSDSASSAGHLLQRLEEPDCKSVLAKCECIFFIHPFCLIL